MGLVALAAFISAFYPKGVAADMDTQVGVDTDLTSTLKMDKKSEEWEVIVNQLLTQRQKQIEQKLAEEKLAAEERERVETQRRAAQAAQVKKAIIVQVPIPVTGNKVDWMTAAGIPEGLWGYVDIIVSRESGWNPNAVNKSSGSCGLGQQLPCGKWAGAWNDPVAALKAMTAYVNARYGGWAGAVAFWNANHWY